MGRQADPRPVTLDAGALIALDNGNRSIAVLIQRARDLRARIVVPAGVLAQVWRDGRRQARLAALLSGDGVYVDDLTAIRARAVGELCGRAGVSDVVDASVVLAAKRYGGLVVTGDRNDLLSIDPTLPIVEI